MSFIDDRKKIYNTELALKDIIRKSWKITEKEFLMGRDKEYPLTEELKLNMFLTLSAVNVVREIYNKPMTISSGYRPGKYNVAAGGASKSTHLTCEAVDFVDDDKEIGKWCQENVPVLEALGIYIESLDTTHKGPNCWVHMQIRPTKNRFFKP